MITCDCETDDDGNVVYECQRCNRRARAMRVKDLECLSPFYIVVYGMSCHYGGPEEGGWYWDRTEALEVRKVWDWRQGLRVARELRRQYPTQEHSRFSVLGNGQDTYITLVTSPDYIRENLTRPEYE